VKDIAEKARSFSRIRRTSCPAATDIDLPGDLYVSNSIEDRIESLRGANAQKLLAVPISSDGQRLGILIVADKENRAGGVDDFHPETDGRILMLFGNQAAIALENARLHKEALEKGTYRARDRARRDDPRRSFRHAARRCPGSSSRAETSRPGRSAAITSTCFRFPTEKPPSASPTAGKGVPAALLVSTVHACLHLLLPALSDDLVALSVQLNRHLVRYSSTRKFATLLLAVFDPKTRELRYVNAGHSPASSFSGGEVTCSGRGALRSACSPGGPPRGTHPGR
jgi:sigma-B regulation protein RsbU (phosphoserine phosphatase)